MAKLKEPTELQLAYLAGVIDSDGYITINQSCRKGVYYHAPCIGISGTRRQPHDLAASFWGGKVYRYAPKNPSHRAQYQWSRQGEAAAEIVELLFPYLLIKSDHAVTAGELWDNILGGKGENPYPWFGPDYDPMPERFDLRQQMIDLNQSRNRVRTGRLLDGVQHNGRPEA